MSNTLLLGGQNIMASATEKQLCLHVSRTLDCLGKSHDMIKYRAAIYRKWQTQDEEQYKPMKMIHSGSKGEGLTSFYESDHDQMCVFPRVICADNTQDFVHIRQTTLFQTVRHDTPPGYTKLKQIKCKIAV